jgi:4-amino-4-deoxy-L-arabinose transferase-like glycosyltransferase
LSAFGLNLLSPRLATLVRTDMPLALVIFILGSLTWMKIRSRQRWRSRDRVAVFALLTAGMLIKGPVVWAFLLPAIVAFELWRRKEDTVSAFPGFWPWIASLGIFIIWVWVGIRTIPGFYDQVVMREFVGRFGGEVHRAQPVWFYVPHLLHKFAPWSVVLVAIATIWLQKLNWNWRSIHLTSETRWLICWSLAGVMVMSLLPSKRVDRVFPVLPPLCILLAAQVNGAVGAFRQPKRLYAWVAAAIAFALIFTAGYVVWKVTSGYHEHRDALATFGTQAREYVATHQFRYAVISSRDEGLLLYARQTTFVSPEEAISRWNAADVDAVVAENSDLPRFVDQLRPPGAVVLRSPQRLDGGASDYVLIARPPS